MFRKLVIFAVLIAFAFPASAELHLREYGVGTTINFKLYDVTTGGLDVNESDGGAEVQLSCDEGADSTATNDFVDEGNYYSIALTAAEMQCARLAISVEATDTNVVFVETYGASGLMDAFPANVTQFGGSAGTFSSGIPDVNAEQWNNTDLDTTNPLPNAAADAAGGLPISDAGGLDLDGLSTVTTAQVNTEVDTALADYDGVVPADLPTNFGDLSVTATTGRVDVAAVAGTAQTANDNGADINTLVSRVPDTISLAAINAQVDTALSDYDALVAGDLGSATDFGSGATLFGMLNDLADNGTATFDRSTDSLQAIRDRGDASWTTGGGGSCTGDVGCIADGTAQSVTATTIQLASAETFADDEIIGATVLVNSATAGTGQSRLITDYVSSTDTATVDTWTTTPTGTITYRVFSTPPGSTTSPVPANMVEISFDSTAANNLEAATDGTGYNVGNGSVVAASVTGNVGGVAGTLNTLDDLDTAQDTQHGTTQSAISALNDLSAADANAQMDTALADIHLDHLLAADYDPATPPGTSTALLNELIESDAGVSRFTVNALEQGPSGSGASAASIADAVWDEAQSGHVSAGSFGLIASEIADILVDTAEIGAAGAGLTESGGTGDQFTGLNDPTAASIADAVWDELQSAHTTVGSFGEIATEIAAVEVDTETTLPGILGTPAGADLAADIAAIPTVAEILAGQVEDQGSGYDLKCALATLIAYAAGEVTTSGGISTYTDPSGTESRIVGTVSGSSRGTVTITCP